MAETVLESPPQVESVPLLRTLAPALRTLDQRLRGWLNAPRRRSLSTLTQGTFEGLSNDLLRQSDALDVDQPLLTIMFMGGTGVGKSTLLNAVAKAAVAQASFSRPTTRDPVVYYHQSVRPERLEPALRRCRLVAHDRPGLEQKILVDTPDLDSNEIANREKLKELLGIADVVLYVGSQEKYHDKLGWELFIEQRKRRAFAFVLNKWDRCTYGLGNGSVRPDDDLLRDLQGEGFEQPMIFRTCAQHWVDANGRPPSSLPEGEQFRDLENWLELGLTRLEIEAIKARGVGQLLAQLEQALESGRPPALADAAVQTAKAWKRSLGDEAEAMADALLVTIDPYQREIEKHFAMEGHRRFRGLMAGFLHLVTRLRYFGASFRSKLPLPLRGGLTSADASAKWDLDEFSKACSGLASDRHLDSRSRALPNQLLVLAGQNEFPVSLLNESTEAASKMVNWRQRFATVLIEVLREVETQWVRPTGPKKWLEAILIRIGDVLPLLALLSSIGFLLWGYYSGSKAFYWTDFILPFAVVFFTLIVMYVIIMFALPIHWPAIRGTFHRQLARRLDHELSSVYASIPNELAEALAVERKQMEQLLGECRELADWLREREQATTVAGLYGG